MSSSGRIVANDAGGFYVAYQHYWLGTLRSSAVGSYAWVDSTGKTLTTNFNKSWYAAANLIYKPRGTSSNIGVEYLWGQHQLSSGVLGHANRIQSASSMSSSSRRRLHEDWQDVDGRVSQTQFRIKLRNSFL